MSRKLKIGIIYDKNNGRDKSIEKLSQAYAELGVPSQHIDINDLYRLNGALTIDENKVRSIISGGVTGFLNRIVPSSKSELSVKATLSLLSMLENMNYPVINSLTAAEADYSKLKGYQLLKEKGVATPETIPLDNYGKALEFIQRYGLPVIVKDDCGGGGRDVVKVKEFSELEEMIKETQEQGPTRILQQFVIPNRGYDGRIAVFDGKVIAAYGRSLTNGDGTPAWKGSYCSGSQLTDYQATPEEIDLALRSTAAIDAVWNEVDIYFSKEGPKVIENNPTPGYTKNNGNLVKANVLKSLGWFESKLPANYKGGQTYCFLT